MFWNANVSAEQTSTVLINRKHEMFWNSVTFKLRAVSDRINRKHEMFWNELSEFEQRVVCALTVNMKCFEIFLSQLHLIVLGN